MRKKFMFLTSLLLTQSSLVFAQQKDTEAQKLYNEQVEQSLKMMNQSSNAIATMNTSGSLLQNMVSTLQSLKDREQQEIKQQTDELERKTSECLELINKKDLSKARIKAMMISWTPIGRQEIDKNKIKQFDDVREQLMKQINLSN